MNPRRPAWSAVWCAWCCLLWLCTGCAGACSERPLATLTVLEGHVERDYAAHADRWQTAAVGAELRLGDGIRTGRKSSAELALDDGSRLQVDAETSIRFSARAPEAGLLDFEVETGQAAVRTGDQPLALATAGGRARLAPRSRLLLAASSAGLRFVVEVGTASLGGSPEVRAGEGLLLAPAGEWSPLPALPEPPELPGPPQPGELEPAPGGAEVDAESVRAHVSGPEGRLERQGRWSKLPPGATELSPASDVELGKRTTVELERAHQRALLGERGRYRIAPRRGVLVAATSGAVSAGGSEPVVIEVPGGVITIAAGGKARVTLDGRRARVDAEERDVVVESGQGRERIHAGQRATLAGNGSLQVEGRGLDHADMTLAAGESLVIHDPTPPTAVQFHYAGVCPGRGLVSIQRRAARAEYAVGERAVALALAPGKLRYELRCGSLEGKIVRRGRVEVLRDPGTRKIASRAPATTVAADGRKYTVLYQNRLPTITLTWPNAPRGDAVALVHRFQKAETKLSLDAPAHTFDSGALREGSHVFQFEGGGKLSRRTEIAVAFDNAAPTAALDTPPVPSARAGDLLDIKGVALPGWEVSVEGQRPALDAQGRFAASVPLPRDRRAVAVRLSHPRQDTHLYLRRAHAP